MAMKKGLQISEYQDFIAYLKSNLSTQRYGFMFIITILATNSLSEIDAYGFLFKKSTMK